VKIYTVADFEQWLSLREGSAADEVRAWWALVSPRAAPTNCGFIKDCFCAVWEVAGLWLRVDLEGDKSWEWFISRGADGFEGKDGLGREEVASWLSVRLAEAQVGEN
jgi:hypothetical protein